MKLIRKIGPRFELPVPSEFEGRKMVLTCHFCGEPGHKLSHCPNLPEDMRDQQQFNGDNDFLQTVIPILSTNLPSALKAAFTHKKISYNKILVLRPNLIV
jgi:hypothetical protein